MCVCCVCVCVNVRNCIHIGTSSTLTSVLWSCINLQLLQIVSAWTVSLTVPEKAFALDDGQPDYLRTFKQCTDFPTILPSMISYEEWTDQEMIVPPNHLRLRATSIFTRKPKSCKYVFNKLEFKSSTNIEMISFENYVALAGLPVHLWLFQLSTLLLVRISPNTSKSLWLLSHFFPTKKKVLPTNSRQEM